MEEHALRRLRHTALVGALLVVVGTAALGAAALQQGAIQPPNLHAGFGAFYIAGFTAEVPLCESHASCSPELAGPSHTVYELWLFSRPSLLSAGKPRVDRLLRLSLRPAAEP